MQMVWWAEHCFELYSRENTIDEPALNAVKAMPIMEEPDAEPSTAELSKAIDSLPYTMPQRRLHEGNDQIQRHERHYVQPLRIKHGMKQGCVLTPTLFDIFFALLLKYAFGTSTGGVYLHARADGRLFNLVRLKAKSKLK